MIKWLIIAGVVIVLVGIIAICIVVTRKKNKKKRLKLDENIKKFTDEKASIDKKEKADEDKRKEAKAFENISLTEDVEEEFKDLFSNPVVTSGADKMDVEVGPNQNKDEIEQFLKELENQQNPKKKKKSRDEEFEDFLREHSYTKKVIDDELLEEIKKLSPRMKALILGNVFHKYDD
ncbi:MAG: hypothetical protein E7379_02825 [Clostridiales bacterium]|nr:hypothetical protein [Clostridiales bacterium]